MPDLQPVKFEIAKTLEWNTWGPLILPRLEASSKLKMRHLSKLDPHEGRAIIVGGGHTTAQFIDNIKELSALPFATLFSVNATHNWLIKRQVIPNIHVIFEYDLDKVATAIGGVPHRDTTYFLASHLSSDLFRDLEAYRCVLWHPHYPFEEYQQAIDKYFVGEFMVGGGYATFFRSLVIALILGYRNFDLFGIDSSFEESSHLDGYKKSNVEQRINIWGRDPRSDTLRKFTSQGGLAFQAKAFMEFCKQHQDKMRLRIHGDTLLRYVHEACYPEQYDPSRKD